VKSKNQITFINSDSIRTRFEEGYSSFILLQLWCFNFELHCDFGILIV
jgi:hypothetical protein